MDWVEFFQWMMIVWMEVPIGLIVLYLYDWKIDEWLEKRDERKRKRVEAKRKEIKETRQTQFVETTGS